MDVAMEDVGPMTVNEVPKELGSADGVPMNLVPVEGVPTAVDRVPSAADRVPMDEVLSDEVLSAVNMVPGVVGPRAPSDMPPPSTPMVTLQSPTPQTSQEAAAPVPTTLLKVPTISTSTQPPDARTQHPESSGSKSPNPNPGLHLLLHPSSNDHHRYV